MTEQERHAGEIAAQEKFWILAAVLRPLMEQGGKG
jgi:hypothetical protein